MTDNYPNVLRPDKVAEQTAYRTAVKNIIASIQVEYDCTYTDIAEAIGVCTGTIENAALGNNDMSVTFLNRIGQAFGPEFLNPYAALSGGRMVPLEPSDDDALPALASLVSLMVQARSPDSDGGERITHRELLAMVPRLKAAQSAITNQLMKASQL